jgi:heptosyltransferase-2
VERLVMVAPGWLGDAVMALPALADVRSSRREASLAVAARASVAPLYSLVRRAGGVDDVITLPPRGAWPIGERDIAILLPNSFRSALAVARAGVRERWGYRADWRRLLLTRAVAPVPGRLHQIDRYQRLVAALGFANGPATPRLAVPPDARDAGAAILRRAGWNGKTPLAAIAPGAAFGSAKRWPPAAFADLAGGLADDGVATVMVGAAADRATAAGVTRALGGRATLIDVVGQTDIPALAGVLSHCRALAANDSGALHLGAAIGIRVTAVFGPTDEAVSAPRGATVLAHDTWCRPCGLRECPLDHACMLGVPAADALAAVRRAL